jgi:hypothetical protein
MDRKKERTNDNNKFLKERNRREKHEPIDAYTVFCILGSKFENAPREKPVRNTVALILHYREEKSSIASFHSSS